MVQAAAYRHCSAQDPPRQELLAPAQLSTCSGLQQLLVHHLPTYSALMSPPPLPPPAQAVSSILAKPMLHQVGQLVLARLWQVSLQQLLVLQDPQAAFQISLAIWRVAAQVAPWPPFLAPPTKARQEPQQLALEEEGCWTRWPASLALQPALEVVLAVSLVAAAEAPPHQAVVLCLFSGPQHQPQREEEEEEEQRGRALVVLSSACSSSPVRHNPVAVECSSLEEVSQLNQTVLEEEELEALLEVHRREVSSTKHQRPAEWVAVVVVPERRHRSSEHHLSRGRLEHLAAARLWETLALELVHPALGSSQILVVSDKRLALGSLPEACLGNLQGQADLDSLPREWQATALVAAASDPVQALALHKVHQLETCSRTSSHSNKPLQGAGL
mmetsp:Transcript_33843/g.75376  ORF Transcript_33843/g.75376 Transcript_33843/m.75376 type:complete len:387 (+) Transcript_33843:1442-2602(+)